MKNWNRRKVLAAGAALGTAAITGAKLHAAPERRFSIGVTDWNLKKTGDVSALELAKELGIEGVQVSFDAPGVGMDLREEKNRRAYLAEAKRHGVRIAGLAMGVLNKIPYKSAPETEQWVSESITAAQAMGAKVILLAFFSAGDLKGDAAGTKEVIRRLKAVAPQAEKAGVILGVESWLDADEHIAILDAIDSPAVQIYYDCGNMNKQGYDIYAEIRKLGAKRICQVHAKDYAGKLFGQGDVDFWKVRRALDDIGYRGWVVIEGRTPFGLEDSYRHDVHFLRQVFRA